MTGPKAGVVDRGRRVETAVRHGWTLVRLDCQVIKPSL